jgi:hypothetical protein
MARDYYVSLAGVDTNPGTFAQPWKTIAKVNTIAYVAGDRIFFNGGDTFPGNLTFGVGDGGTAASPVLIASYGTGRATINGGTFGGIFIHNTAGFHISNLNLVGSGALTNQQDGIFLLGDLPNAPSALTYIYIDHVDIQGFGLSGIYYQGNAGCVFKDITITDSTIHDNHIDGIFGTIKFTPPITTHDTVTIRNCTTYNNTGIARTQPSLPSGTYLGREYWSNGSGIAISFTKHVLIDGCLSYNNGVTGWGSVGIWCYDTDDITIQGCESHHNHGAIDGDGIDLDGDTTNATVQYNYCHDNDGAGILCQEYPGAAGPWGPNVIRYNLLINNSQVAYGGLMVEDDTAGTMNGAEVYGNTIIDNRTCVYFNVRAKNWHFRNNIFVGTGAPAASLAVIPTACSTGLVMQGNDYWSGGGAFSVVYHGVNQSTIAAFRSAASVETSAGYVVDPGFVGGAGVGAYRLQAGSPLIGTGINLLVSDGKAGTPLNPGTRDFYGGLVPIGLFDVGAHEYSVLVGESGNSNEVSILVLTSGNSNEVSVTIGGNISGNSNEVVSQAHTLVNSSPSNEIRIHAHGLRFSGDSFEFGPIYANASLLEFPPLAPAPVVICGPTAPTVLGTITDGMIEAGQYQVTPAQVATFAAAQFQTLKSEMWLKVQTDELLEMEVVLLAQRGISSMQVPCDFDTDVSLTLYSGERGVALDGTGQTTTLGLATTARQDEEALLGVPIFLTSWNGAPQMRQIVGYNPTRNVVTVDGPWDWMPTRGTGYVLGTTAMPLIRTDHRRLSYGSGIPRTYTRSGLLLTVLPAADQTYPLLMLYRANLTRVNEDSTVFLTHLRERRALWMQGIKAKTMARFDDERAPQEEQKWQLLLNQYAASNAVYEQMEGSR